MHSKTKFKLILAVLAIIMLVNLAVLYLVPTKPSEYTVKPIRAVSLLVDDIDDNIPLYGDFHDIIYYSNNGTWILREREEYNKEFNKKYYIAMDKYELYSYSPNASITSSNISFDFGIRNMMGVDILEIPLTIETRISSKEEETISTSQRVLILNNLKEGEYRKVRVTAELIKPAENETLQEAIILTTPFEIKALNGGLVKQNMSLPASGSANFYIKSAYKYNS